MASMDINSRLTVQSIFFSILKALLLTSNVAVEKSKDFLTSNPLYITFFFWGFLDSSLEFSLVCVGFHLQF